MHIPSIVSTYYCLTPDILFMLVALLTACSETITFCMVLASARQLVQLKFWSIILHAIHALRKESFFPYIMVTNYSHWSGANASCYMFVWNMFSKTLLVWFFFLQSSMLHLCSFFYNQVCYICTLCTIFSTIKFATPVHFVPFFLQSSLLHLYTLYHCT
jgi:hypothetical protein